MHQGVALRLAHSVVRSHHDAEEVVQEAFVKAHRNLGGFDRGRAFRPWLLRIVRNEALNQVRSRDRRRRLTLRASGLAETDPLRSPDEHAVATQERQRLLEAIDRLPQEFREVIICRYLVELGEAETASVLSLPVGTVKSRASRGIDRLRTMIAAESALGEAHE